MRTVTSMIALAAAAVGLSGCVFAVNTSKRDDLEKRLVRLEERLERLEHGGPGMGGPHGPPGHPGMQHRRVKALRRGPDGAFLHLEVEDDDGSDDDLPLPVEPAPMPGGT
jgi:hypothetical protein